LIDADSKTSRTHENVVDPFNAAAPIELMGPAT
jgi:hypothetical protein